MGSLMRMPLIYCVRLENPEDGIERSGKRQQTHFFEAFTSQKGEDKVAENLDQLEEALK